MLSRNAIQSQFGTGVNFATARDVYPTAPGATLGQIASAQTPYTTDAVTAASNGPAAAPANGNGAAPANGASSPRAIIVTILTLIVLLVALGFIGNKLGGREGQTGLSNLKLSGYNIAYISLASVIGIGLLKVLFTRFRVPGVSTYISAI